MPANLKSLPVSTVAPTITRRQTLGGLLGGFITTLFSGGGNITEACSKVESYNFRFSGQSSSFLRQIRDHFMSIYLATERMGEYERDTVEEQVENISDSIDQLDDLFKNLRFDDKRSKLSNGDEDAKALFKALGKYYTKGSLILLKPVSIRSVGNFYSTIGPYYESVPIPEAIRQAFNDGIVEAFLDLNQESMSNRLLVLLDFKNKLFIQVINADNREKAFRILTVPKSNLPPEIKRFYPTEERHNPHSDWAYQATELIQWLAGIMDCEGQVSKEVIKEVSKNIVLSANLDWFGQTASESIFHAIAQNKLPDFTSDVLEAEKELKNSGQIPKREHEVFIQGTIDKAYDFIERMSEIDNSRPTKTKRKKQPKQPPQPRVKVSLDEGFDGVAWNTNGFDGTHI